VERFNENRKLATTPGKWELIITLERASGEYEIPEDASLGNYQLFFSVNDAYADRIFAVAEYRKPEFQVTLAPGVEETLRGQPVEFVLEAEYFFGGSASDLNVNWTVYEDDFRLPWQGPYYSFGDDGGFYYEAGFPFRFGGEGTFGRYLTGGSGKTDAQGRLVIQLPADLLDEVDPGSRRVTVQADVMDITNFPITARNSVIYHAAESYVGVRARDYFGTAGSEAAIELVTVDWEGQSLPNSPVEVVFYQREWIPVRDRQYGQPFTLWEVEDTEVDRQSVTTDDQGKATLSFTPPEGGQYLAVATVTDGGGRSQTSSVSMWVMDQNYFGWRSDPKEKRMDLTADQTEYKPGDVARVLVQSPFEGPITALEQVIVAFLVLETAAITGSVRPVVAAAGGSARATGSARAAGAARAAGVVGLALAGPVGHAVVPKDVAVIPKLRDDLLGMIVVDAHHLPPTPPAVLVRTSTILLFGVS